MEQKHARTKRAIERAVTDVCGLRGTHLWFAVDQVEATGRSVKRIKVWATLRFLNDGSPFCCREPGCHLSLFGDRLAEINERLSAELHPPNRVVVDFGDRVGVHYDPGVTFRSHFA